MDLVERESCFPLIDIIEENLYLGGLKAALNLYILKQYNITHILTVDVKPLASSVTEQQDLVTLFIKAYDQPKEDLLSFFHETNSFIEKGKEKGTVLVHCYFGKSRSATVIIAYLMQKYKMTYYEALNRVKGKRKVVSPNSGFVDQLKLYKDMGYRIDNKNMQYKIYMLSVAAFRREKEQILPQKFHKLIQHDPNIQQFHSDLNIYRCKKCRRILATKSNLLTHVSNEQTCRETYFIEPITWMNAVHGDEGKLLCPKCSTKVGSYSWTKGCRCTCGVKVTPAFYLIPSKVEYCSSLQQQKYFKRKKK